MDEIPDPGDYVIDCDGAWLRPRNQNSATVLQIGGEIDARNADAIRAHTHRYAVVAMALVVDATAVDFLSVKGLRTFISLDGQCHDTGIEWMLIGSDSVRRLLRAGNAEHVLPMAESVAAALQRITIATVGYGSGG